MRRASHSLYACQDAVAREYLADAFPVQGIALIREEQECALGPHRLRPEAVDVVPQHFLNLPAYRDEALLVALAQHFYDAFLEAQVPQLDAAELRDAHAGVEHQEQHSQVALPHGGGQVDDGDEGLQLGGREGGDDLARGARDPDLLEGMRCYYALGKEPREEDAQAAGIAVHGIGRQGLVALRGEGVAGVALLLLQITDEALYSARRYSRDGGQRAEGGQEAREVAHGAFHRLDASHAVSGTGGKEAVAL